MDKPDPKRDHKPASEPFSGSAGKQPSQPRRTPPGIVMKDHRRQLENVSRRLFFRQGLSLGALTMLTGCNLQDDTAVDRALWAMSRWNDRVQAFLFDPHRLAPTFRLDDITDPFPFNAFYAEDSVPDIDLSDYRLTVSGRVDNKAAWRLEDLRRLPQAAQITQHICIEGWSAIGQWSGVPLGLFLQRIGADLTANYVGFKCADRYYSSIDMPSALHPQTILALDFRNDPLPLKYGSPVKLRIPTKLGFKNPKHIVEIFVTNDYPGGYWEDQGYNWFSGL